MKWQVRLQYQYIMVRLNVIKLHVATAILTLNVMARSAPLDYDLMSVSLFCIQDTIIP